MPELSITEAIGRAEEAIETGNYDRAIDICQRVLGEFPEFASAFCLMGEAHLEKGEFDEAKSAFQRTLERDPQSIAAHLGLAKIAEEQSDINAALAHYQVAWEIDPRRRDLREHVSRVSQQVYGEDGRLYLTRAALASLHFHAGRWDRAVSEANQVLQEQQGRVDVQIRMAEALWRRGDNYQASQVTGTLLRLMPSAVVPLLILADIERRNGNSTEAEALLERARGVDPSGSRSAEMVTIGQDEQSDFLLVEDIPTIDESVLTEAAPGGRYAPAPDFMAEEPAPAEFSIDEAISEEPAQQQDDSGTTAEDPASVAPPVRPFRWEDLGDEDLEVPDLGGEFEIVADVPPEAAPPPVTSEPPPPPADEPEEDETISFELFSDEELDKARPGTDRLPGFTGVLRSLEGEGMLPFDPANPDQGVPLGLPPEEEKSGPEPSESDEAGEQSERAEVESDFEISLPEDWLSDGETGDQPGEQPADVEVKESSSQDSDDPFDLDWGQVDREIQDAIPGEIPRGYTGELRALDEIGVEPFSFQEESDAPPETETTEPAASEPDDVEVDPAGQTKSGDEFDFSEFETLSTRPAETEPHADQETPEETVDWREIDLDLDEPEESGTDEIVDDPYTSGDEVVDELFGQFEPQTSRLETPEQTETDAAGAENDEPIAMPAPETDDDREVAETTEADLSEVQFDEPVVVEFAEDADQSINVGATSQLSVDDATDTLKRLGLEQELLDRARQAKTDLISSGRIDGTVRLPSLGPNLDQLEAAVESEPDNAEHRVALANALVETDPERAISQFRWVYVHADDRSGDIIDGLLEIAGSGGDQEVHAHRLAGALYRRAGDWQAAASHFEESLLRR